MLETFSKVINRFRNDCLVAGYEPLLEADVSGWLFHLLLTSPDLDPVEVHLDTRVYNADGRFDIAIGPLKIGTNGKPCVEAHSVLEIKVFPRTGFTNQQHREHYEHILKDDLRKLGTLELHGGFCSSLILDGRGYLTGSYKGENRREFLVSRRNKIAPQAHIFIIRLEGDDWYVDHESPVNIIT
jgi:hypothetical protein